LGGASFNSKKYIVKKLLFIALALGTFCASHAQIRLTNQSTNTNVSSTVTSYINFNTVQSRVKSAQFTVNKTSGTLAGTVYLQGTDDGIGWYTIDSLTLVDQAQNVKMFFFTGTQFNSYRGNFKTTGTSVSTLYMTLLRRTDE